MKQKKTWELYRDYELRQIEDRWQIYSMGKPVNACLYSLVDARRAVDEIIMRNKQ